ncbi:hypothetical protein Tco_0515393 [Tanacetum coccineum]
MGPDYLTATRPDIQFSTVICARYQSNTKESHLIAMKRILRYMKGTPTLGLYYPKWLGFDLKGYSDYAGCNMDRKSTLGACQILWMKSQLSDYDIHYKMVPIFCDKTSAIAISNNPVLHLRTKHIDIIYHFIRDHILKGDIELHFILTEYQLADSFTKPLDEPTFTRLKEELGIEENSRVRCSGSGVGRRVLLGLDYTQDESFRSSPTILSNSKFSKDPSKVTLIKLTDFMVAVNKCEHSGPEAPGSLPQKRKKPKYKKIPNETKVTPPKLTEGSKQSQLVSSGTVPDLQDPERNIQLAGTGLPSTLDEPTDRGLPSTASDEDAAKTTPIPEGPRGDKDSEGLKPPAYMEPQTNPVADPSGTGAKYQVDETQSTQLRIAVIREYLVKVNKRRTFWSLNKDILKITILKTNTLYPLRRYDVSMPELTKDHEGNKPIRRI